MLELADIVRAAGAVYQRLSGSHLRPAQQRALHDIVACRTAALGGHVRACDHCATGTAPSVTGTRPGAGWIGSEPACCPAPTSC
jgi:hypothetical protein